MIDIQKMEQMHEFVTLLTSGIKKAELEARLRTVLESFREAVVQELVAGSGEPVAYRTEDSTNGVSVWLFKKTAVKYQDPPDALYTADQMAAAVLRERERCAKLVEADPSYDWHKFACECAAAIRIGE